MSLNVTITGGKVKKVAFKYDQGGWPTDVDIETSDECFDAMFEAMAQIKLVDQPVVLQSAAIERILGGRAWTQLCEHMALHAITCHEMFYPAVTEAGKKMFGTPAIPKNHKLIDFTSVDSAWDGISYGFSPDPKLKNSKWHDLAVMFGKHTINCAKSSYPEIQEMIEEAAAKKPSKNGVWIELKALDMLGCTDDQYEHDAEEIWTLINKRMSSHVFAKIHKRYKKYMGSKLKELEKHVEGLLKSIRDNITA